MTGRSENLFGGDPSGPPLFSGKSFQTTHWGPLGAKTTQNDPNNPTMTMNMTLIVILTLTLFLSMDRSGMPSPPGAGRLSAPAPQQQRICFREKRALFPTGNPLLTNRSSAVIIRTTVPETNVLILERRERLWS